MLRSTPGRTTQIDPKSGRNDAISFRNMQWGMTIKEMPGLKKRGTADAYGGIDEYYDPDDPLTMGNALLDGVMYGFWQGKLYTITIWTLGRKQYRNLKTEAFKRYGNGLQKNQVLERYIWYGDITDKLLQYDEETNSGILWMRSHQIDRRIKKLYPE